MLKEFNDGVQDGNQRHWNYKRWQDNTQFLSAYSNNNVEHDIWDLPAIYKAQYWAVLLITVYMQISWMVQFDGQLIRVIGLGLL